MPCEWLIDLIKEWVITQAYATEAWVLAKTYATELYVHDRITELRLWVLAQGYLKTSFVDRGDPAAVDFTQATLTIDGAWHELDLSSIIPANAKGVCIAALILDFNINRFVQLRTAGNANIFNVSSLTTQVSLVVNNGDLTVALDADRKIEYKISAAGVLALSLTIKNWWF